jgi:hypothetical protein
MLLLGFVPVLLAWLFGRACRLTSGLFPHAAANTVDIAFLMHVDLAVFAGHIRSG